MTKLQEALKSYRMLKDMHRKIFGGTVLTLRATAQAATKEELADLVYVLRQCEQLVNDTRKDITAVMELCEQIACLKWMTDDPTGSPIRGTLSTASPEVKQMASLPRQSSDPEGYAKLMDYLQIPEAVRDRDLLRIHWPAFTDLITELASNGKPLPPGIKADNTYPLYKLRCRKKAGVDIDEMEDEPDTEN